MSRVLQELRDAGEIEFLGSGRYRILISPTEGAAHQAALEQGRWLERHWDPSVSVTRSRPYQAWLRSHVLLNFGHACGFCGLAPETLLDAAHLRAVRDHPRFATEPTAAILACKNHHRAMDLGMIRIRKDLSVEVTSEPSWSNNEAFAQWISSLADKPIRTPLRWDLNPDALPSMPVTTTEQDTSGASG